MNSSLGWFGSFKTLLSSTRQRQPEPAWLPVEKVISPATVLMEPAFHAKQITLKVEIPDHLSAHLGRCGKDASSVGERIYQCLSRHSTAWICQRVCGNAYGLDGGTRPRSPGN